MTKTMQVFMGVLALIIVVIWNSDHVVSKANRFESSGELGTKSVNRDSLGDLKNHAKQLLREINQRQLESVEDAEMATTP